MVGVVGVVGEMERGANQVEGAERKERAKVAAQITPFGNPAHSDTIGA